MNWIEFIQLNWIELKSVGWLSYWKTVKAPEMSNWTFTSSWIININKTSPSRNFKTIGHKYQMPKMKPYILFPSQHGMTFPVLSLYLALSFFELTWSKCQNRNLNYCIKKNKLQYQTWHMPISILGLYIHCCNVCVLCIFFYN